MAVGNRKPNRLVNEKSPYLLQHAYNPVDWYSWCDEAFELARKENKPIFLSIGYSTCHWCHVMEHESFCDEDVAKLMNDIFVSIKVDREERPDIDNIYMTVCQVMTGSGGWPLTILMTPNKEPFFSGTYFPKQNQYGRIGMLDLIPRIKEIWEKRQDEVLSSAKNIINALQKISESPSQKELDKDILDVAFSQLTNHFDEKEGGFGGSPKFPTPHNLLFLLRYWKRTLHTKALQMVEKTLLAMRMGGIYDHLGFGFHRYSTDSSWLVPHFEKMLYDQAMLAMAYTEAFQVTKNERYRNTAKEIFTYVLRDMTSPEGGFYSAEDADSEGEEGKFYVWSYDEIKKILGNEEAELFIKIFNVKREKAGENILFLKEGEGESEVNEPRFQSVRQKLFNEREKRIHPHKDDKILTSWNGLMIAALAKAGQAFNVLEYISSAKNAANFILKNMQSKGKLLHTFRDSKAAINGHLDDYAFLIWGLLELYEATFEIYYLQTALNLNEVLIEHFWDKENGGFYFTSDEDEKLILRQKEFYDSAIPSGNSVSMLNLLRLSKITANSQFEEYARKIGSAFSENIKRSPISHLQLMCALDFLIGPTCEIVIAGNVHSEDTKNMLRAIIEVFIPNKVLVFNPSSIVGTKATAYVCKNYTCTTPTTDLNQLIKLLS